MVRLLLTLFLVIAASLFYGYFRELNPDTITIHTGPNTEFLVSPVTLILLAMAVGALLVTLMVGVREARHWIANWQQARLRRRQEKIDGLHRDGVHAFLSKRPADAITRFQKVLALDPNHFETLLWLGHLHRMEENYHEAIHLHRKARTVDDRNIEVMLELAKDLEGAKRFEEALQLLQEILKVDQTNLPALFHRRDLYMRLEQWEEALAVQERLVKADLSDADRRAQNAIHLGLTYEVGRQFLERGQPDKARRYFRGAIKRDKNFLPAYIGLAAVVVSEGKTKHAAELLEKVYAKTGMVIILHRLEELYLELGEPSEIIRAYQEAVERDPQNPVLKFYLGKLFYRLEMVDEAMDVLSTLDGLQGQMADYHKIMANLYLRKQQPDLAVEELKKALGFRKRVVVPYVCAHCQLNAAEWSGRCRRCGLWNTLVTRTLIDPAFPAQPNGDATEVRPIPYQGIASPFETV